MTKKNETETNKTQLDTVTHDLGHSLGEMVSNLTDDFSDASTTSRKYIKQHPAKTLAIATAAGVIIGSILTLILTRRKSH